MQLVQACGAPGRGQLAELTAALRWGMLLCLLLVHYALAEQLPLSSFKASLGSVLWRAAAGWHRSCTTMPARCFCHLALLLRGASLTPSPEAAVLCTPQCVEEPHRLADNQRVCFFRDVFFWRGQLHFVTTSASLPGRHSSGRAICPSRAGAGAGHSGAFGRAMFLHPPKMWRSIDNEGAGS